MTTLEQLRRGELQGTNHVQLAAGLTEFPPELYALTDTLEILDLSNNQLTNLPDDLERFGKLRVLFASNNRFRHVPEGIGRCGGLQMLGFKHNRIEEVGAAALPASLRWLILTDNCISRLPERFGDLVAMEKLALAGNRLQCLPDSMANMHKLGLLRISANQLQAFPDLLLELPQLAWLAFAGNPFCMDREEHDHLPHVALKDLQLQEVLGRGASGLISRAGWVHNPAGLDEQVAVKVFHGEVTSDGYPLDELDACLGIDAHPNLVTPIARIQEPGTDALVMRLIPDHYRNLGQPPSLDSCTRDTFTWGQAFSQAQVDAMVAQMTSVVEHLEAAEILHGDLYAHNTLVAPDGHILFGDFGAASRYGHLSEAQKAGLRRIERRSLQYFADDLAGLVNDRS